MIQGEPTGERYVPTRSTDIEVLVNLDRYRYAMEQCIDKHVLELGSGCGMGTYLYSLVAKTVTAVDYDHDGIQYARTYPFDPDKVSFYNQDLTEMVPVEKFDVTVALEFLEHVDDPAAILRQLDTKYLVFSLPLDSMNASKYHKYAIRPGKDGVKDVEELIKKSNFRIEQIQIQNQIGNRQLVGCNWVLGVAKRRKSWL